jgi:hypothetical protein
VKKKGRERRCPMTSSTGISTANHQKDLDLEKIYHDLKTVFAEKDFEAFLEECERVTSVLDNHPKPIYCPVQYNSAKHKISSTTAKEYLYLLPDEDSNTDLKSLKPVETINDGTVLIRAVASLLGISSEENVRELRLRCLIDAVLNYFNYGTEHKELQRIIGNPDQTSMKNWSSLVHERSQVNYLCQENIDNKYYIFSFIDG